MMTDKAAPNKKASKKKGEILNMTVEDGLAWIILDIPGEAQNTLNPKFGTEFEAILASLETDPTIVAAVFASGKKNSFIAGADVNMLDELGSANEVCEMSLTSQAWLKRLEALKVPVVCAIQGACLGGGLEFALACHGRVAADDKKTLLALPEVKLGLIPGAGGTQRLPRLIGLTSALDLILTGRNIRPKKANKLGLVDDVCPPAILREAAAKLARNIAQNGRKKRRPQLSQLALENPVTRQVIFAKAKSELKKKTGGHYPAPFRALEAIQTGYNRGIEAGYKREAKLFGESVMDPVAKNLMSLFFATTALKKDTGVDENDVKTISVEKLGVLGGGLMGGGIAYVASAKAGLRVRVKDKDDAGVARVLSYVNNILIERTKKKRLTRLEAQEQFARISATIDYSGFASTDMVIEAVFEDLDLKKRILKDIESVITKDCIFASNTSTIPITEIAKASSRPETVLGMHFFSPVHKMPLLEIIVTKKTAPWATATAVKVGKKLGKTVIVVNDGPGFYTSRILGPYMNEAAHLLAEGVPLEVIDEALTKFGFPVGPITLLDEVGIDVAEKAGKVMHKFFSDRLMPPDVVARLVASGRHGRKNKKGFYLYNGKKKQGKKMPDKTVYEVLGVVPSKNHPPLETMGERVGLQMINEAALCLGDGILRCARDGDIGAIFGLGFPPFSGGPFRWIDTVGVKNVVDKLDRLREKHGTRFEAAPILREHAKSNKRFHK